MKKTFIYIDGFNFYYRLKNSSFKWLNIEKLSKFYLDPTKHKIGKIKYFTARVKRNVNDSSNVVRQNTYLRAIQTLPNCEVIFGQFKKRQIKAFLSNEDDRNNLGKDIVKVKKWEEKKSDVNIATHIVSDAYRNEFECAVLISNDTDLTPPLLHIKKKLNKLVIVISPYERVHIDLKKSAHFYQIICPEVFEKCQFPEKMTDMIGEFYCPPQWKK